LLIDFLNQITINLNCTVHTIFFSISGSTSSGM
jgi:hypothetical protein